MASLPSIHRLRAAILAVLPESPSGVTVAELKTGVLPRLPDKLFPAGAKEGWWLKGVQLGLEAKGMIERAPASKPLRLRRVPGSVETGISTRISHTLRRVASGSAQLIR